ncbi:hypothetical protein [Bacillus niameyensis]|uniref:hypothetical protein n=1 Tax=Bacillus niameyensis TaxID=1522308 RepID=UPI000A6F1B0C|nr:hypothetical protein [Bacillus niameyensis]
MEIFLIRGEQIKILSCLYTRDNGLFRIIRDTETNVQDAENMLGNGGGMTVLGR